MVNRTMRLQTVLQHTPLPTTPSRTNCLSMGSSLGYAPPLLLRAKVIPLPIPHPSRPGPNPSKRDGALVSANKLLRAPPRTPLALPNSFCASICDAVTLVRPRVSLARGACARTTAPSPTNFPHRLASPNGARSHVTYAPFPALSPRPYHIHSHAPLPSTTLSLKHTTVPFNLYNKSSLRLYHSMLPLGRYCRIALPRPSWLQPCTPRCP